MSIWGTLIGGAAGFAMGGPLGAMLGASFGRAVGNSFVGSSAYASEDATRKISFTIGFIALAAKMAKADGHVTKDEVDAFKEVFHISPHEMKNVGRVFDMARQDTAGYEAYAQQIETMFRHSPQVLEDLLGALFHIAKADGVIHPGELEFLENVARIFGFEGGAFDGLKATWLGPDKADPYVILGVERSISDKDLKKAYYKLIKENHPDKLMANGVPQEFIEIANEKLAVINTAYDRIEAERELK